MSVRGKFHCNSIEVHPNWMHKGEKTHVVKLTAVGDDGTAENKRFAAATPSGSIEMTVDNPQAQVFEPGKEYFVDFTPVES